MFVWYNKKKTQNTITYDPKEPNVLRKEFLRETGSLFQRVRGKFVYWFHFDAFTKRYGKLHSSANAFGSRGHNRGQFAVGFGCEDFATFHRHPSRPTGSKTDIPSSAPVYERINFVPLHRYDSLLLSFANPYQYLAVGCKK